VGDSDTKGIALLSEKAQHNFNVNTCYILMSRYIRGHVVACRRVGDADRTPHQDDNCAVLLLQFRSALQCLF
jgi:hypothetical protein